MNECSKYREALETIRGAFWTDGETEEEKLLDLKAIATNALEGEQTITLNQLSHDVYYGNYHQTTIDFVEEAEELIENYDYTTSAEKHIGKLGALGYRISCIKEILNPEFKDDLQAFEILEKTIDLRIKELSY